MTSRSVALAVLSVIALLGALTAAATPGTPAVDVEAGRRKAEVCAQCHGPDGNATAPGTPSIAGMPAFYTHWQLIMYRDGRRRDPQMTPFAERLGEGDLADVAAFYAAQRATARPASTDPARVAGGRPLAEKFHCTSCHGPRLLGQGQVPRLAGQDFDYLMKRLSGYKAKSASDLDGMMTMVAQGLTAADIESLVHFMASLPPAP